MNEVLPSFGKSIKFKYPFCSPERIGSGGYSFLSSPRSIVSIKSHNISLKTEPRNEHSDKLKHKNNNMRTILLPRDRQNSAFNSDKCQTGRSFANPLANTHDHKVKRQQKSKYHYVGLVLLLVLGLFLTDMSRAYGQITQVTGSPQTNTSGGSSVAIAKPSGLAVGDVMIAQIVQSGGGNTISDATGSGWTLIAGGDIRITTGDRCRATLLYKIATGTDVSASNFTFSFDGDAGDGEGGIVAFANVDINSGPFDVTPGNVYTNIANDNTFNASTITTVTANTAILMFGAINNNYNISNWSTTDPGTLAELYDVPFNAGVDMGMGAAWALKPTIGSTGGGSATISTADYNGAILIALKPAPPAAIVISSPSQVTAGNITQGTVNNVIYNFQNDVTISNATISVLPINTSGVYSSSDLTNLKAWYSADNIFSAGSDILLSTKTTSLGTGTQVFPGWTNRTIISGSTGYIFITADVPCSATAGATISVNAVTPSDVSFLSGSVTGSTTAGGEQTILQATPVNSTGLTGTNGDMSSVLTWSTPSGCFDQVMIVAKEASSVSGTPTGDGSAYTANLAFGSGTGFDGGFVIYKGTTSPQTMTGLTNGTLYHVAVFTRFGTTWSSGVETMVTPVAQSISSDYFRSVASDNWNSTATWESSHDNSSWIPATLTPTSAANTITIRNGDIVTVSANVTVDQVVVDASGTVIVANGITLTIADGTGVDFTVNGTLRNGTGTANSAGGTITTTGALVFNDGGRYQHGYTNNSGLIPVATWNAGSICEIVGYTTFSGNPTSGTNGYGNLTQQFSNFIWNCPSQTAASVISFGGSLNTVNSNFTITSTGSGSISLGGTGSGNLSIGGDFVQSSSLFGSSSAARTITVTGNFSLTGGTLDLSSSTSSSNNVLVNLAGNFTHLAGSLTESGSTTGSGITFNGGGAQQNYT